MKDIIRKLNPNKVFSYFCDICEIPHGSGNTKAISDYCVSFAKAHNLSYVQDSFNNIIIRKPASSGYQNRPTVILQGHLDMVCEKEPDLVFDFQKDPLNLAIDGDFIYAKGTTLGADNGIAVAIVLSILDDDSLKHPSIEALFTVDEETGMYGAEGLDGSLLKGKMLINIDSEEEGILTVGCAGGARAEISIPLKAEQNTAPCYNVLLTGLAGGHSGADINKGRLNANTLLGKFLKELSYLRVHTVNGGLKDNAIPRSCECIITCSDDLTQKAERFIAENKIDTDPLLDIKITKVPTEKQVYDQQSSQKIADFLSGVVNGIVKMSGEIDGLVQTSLNLGILKCKEDTLIATFAVRSSVNSEKYDLLNVLKATATRFDGSFCDHGHYPAWEYRKISPLRDTLCDVYKNVYGTDMKIEAIHAGLECGLLMDKIQGLDAVSMGPNLYDIHTTRERMEISSVQRTYNYLCKVLESI